MVGTGCGNATNQNFAVEATLAITRTFFVREQPGSGKLTYIQNAGVTPDIFLDFMTRENLTGSGRAFVSNSHALDGEAPSKNCGLIGAC